MQIPQGMAYGMLAGVEAKVGLYMAFFPVLVYMIFGTSRHISIGTFAVIALMTLKAVQTHSSIDSFLISNSTNIISNGDVDSQEFYSPIQVVTALAIATSIIHLVMAIFRLGKLSSLLTDPLVKGFTTAAAFHVVTSQLKDVFGITIPRFKGAFKIIYTLIAVIENISEINVATFVFSICIIFFMMIMNEVAKPALSKRCKFPLPAEFMAVLGGTLISKYSGLTEKYSIVVVGEIPVGLPEPFFPPLKLINKLWIDAIAISIVSFSVVISMGLLFAKKHAYEIKPNQELVALGLGNLVGGCFSCMPMCCSLSRSLIQEQTGGETQISSLIAALLILLILLVIGPFFETLPRCVLAGIIIVALKGMFMQFKEVKTFAKQGKMELFIWLITFFSVVIIDYDIGLAIGIIVATGAFFLKSIKPYYCLMGTLPYSETGVYVCLDRHKNAVEPAGIKIFHYSGSLNFATMSGYKKCLFKSIKVNSTQIRRNSMLGPTERDNFLPSFQTLVIDLAAVGHLDVAGCHVLTDVLKEMELIGVRLYLAAPSDRVYDTLIHSMALGEGPFVILPTIHDAVLLGTAYHNT
ncbi:prestin isoform X2 [Condylostylus longicornis]|nr:prestin isoform X2 [Condylostylus longicornis]